MVKKNSIEQKLTQNCNFYFNLDLTSHRRSWWFWSESVARSDEKSFHSVKCKSWKDFKASRCDTKAPIAYMGIDCQLG
jgi:hypothetical protein